MRAGRRHPTFVATALAVACSLAGRGAFAQPAPTPTEEQVAEGRVHFERGVALFDQGNHDGALIEFQRAWELSQRSSVLFNIAATCQALRRYGEAIAALERFLTDARDIRQRRHAQRTLTELRSLIAFVRVSVSPNDATLTLDGHTQPSVGEFTVGPGTHRIEAARAGYNSASAEFTIASGEHRDVQLTLTTAGAATPPPTVVIVDPNRTPTQPHPPPPPPTTLAVLDAPPGATLSIDDAVAPAPDRPMPIAVGPHRLSVSAPGMRPWSGTVTARAGAQHQLQLSLSPTPHELRPLYFWIAAATTGALLIATISTGAAALSAHGDYLAAPAGSPDIATLADRGRSLAIAADILGVATLGAGAAAAVLFTRTEFHVGTSTARFVLAPLPGGGSASATLRF